MINANIVATDTINTGDLYCSPTIYFRFPIPFERCAPQTLGEFQHVICGGGGLLHFDDEIDRIGRATSGKLISWGMGHNTHGSEEIVWKPYMERFDLHGIRDWDTPYRWVPCASCMHPRFDNVPTPSSEVVLYYHFDYPILPPVEIAAKVNTSESMDDILLFLASGECVLTNSYHGVYWATLLGRRVLLVERFSTKFLSFRHPPLPSSMANWKSDKRHATVYSEALEECREANRKYYDVVCNLLSES